MNESTFICTVLTEGVSKHFVPSEKERTNWATRSSKGQQWPRKTPLLGRNPQQIQPPEGCHLPTIIINLLHVSLRAGPPTSALVMMSELKICTVSSDSQVQLCQQRGRQPSSTGSTFWTSNPAGMFSQLPKAHCGFPILIQTRRQT